MLGKRTLQVIQSSVEALNGRGQSDAESGLRVFKDRPRPNPLQSYGAEFTAALEKLPLRRQSAAD